IGNTSVAQSSGGLSLGEPVDTSPQPGQPYLGDTFQDWTLRCVKQESGKDPCQMNQLLKDNSGGSVAEINIFSLAPGGAAVAGATVITPLGTLLTEQITLQVDDREAKRYPFTFCSQQGCLARIGLTASDINAMQKGAAATVRIVAIQAPDQNVILNVSLSGFTAAYDAVLASAE
ncbi:MAG: invasion associated locus B family protein, partial [Pseudomonadota bacterium]